MNRAERATGVRSSLDAKVAEDLPRLLEQRGYSLSEYRERIAVSFAQMLATSLARLPDDDFSGPRWELCGQAKRLAVLFDMDSRNTNFLESVVHLTYSLILEEERE